MDELRYALLDRLESLAEVLLGKPSIRKPRSWRWGRKGSVSLEMQGHKRGQWFDHEAGAGGGPFQFIQHARSCGFVDALAWARDWTGLSSDAPRYRDDAARQEQERKRAEADAEEAADQARRSTYAQRLWSEATDLSGSVAERYLTETRGIPRPAGGWPAAVKFHAPSRSLIVAATTAGGAVQAVQRIRLTEDGRKAEATPERPTKRTNGVLDGAAVRLPGVADGPLLLAEGPETGLSVWAAIGHEAWIALGGIGNLPAPDGRRVVVCRDDDRADSPADRKLRSTIEEWREAGVVVGVATPWPERRQDGSDFNDAIRAGGIAAVRARIGGADWTGEPAANAGPAAPYYPRPHLSGEEASRRLRRIVAAWLDRVERHLEARDWITAEATRLVPAVREATFGRIRANLIRQGMTAEEAEESADTRTDKAAPRLAKRAARKTAIARFGRRAATGPMPRIQITGAAGLGKTRAIIEEYLRRPSLWTRNIAVYCANLDRCGDFADLVNDGAANVPPAPDGSRPRALVIRGRQTEGLCRSDRLKVVDAAQHAGVDSIYRACCHTPAVGNAPETFCPAWAWCGASGYVSQFADRAPALRVLPHIRLRLRQPEDLRLPDPDLVIIDETTVGTLTTSATVDPALLSDLATYASEPGEEHLIQEAADLGKLVVDAIAAGGDAIAVIAAVAEPKHLRDAAAAAAMAADAAKPTIHAGLASTWALDRLKSHKRHEGRAVAAVLAQLARDMDAGRTASVGIEWDAKHQVKMEDGGKALHPIIRSHGLHTIFGAPGALLLLDADADLTINRRLFGEAVRDFTVPAVRQAYVIQVLNCAVAKSSLAPKDSLPNNQAKATALRGSIGELVRREAAGGQQVLVIAPLQVRRAMTGEEEPRVPVSVPWQGGELTHHGRQLGADQWRDFDTVITIGREELPALTAERLARCIWADDRTTTLELPGEYGKAPRHHDLRHGAAPAVAVRVHPDANVQRIVELTRERGVGQAADRLRLIHRTPSHPARVIVLSNLPVPGLVVDRLMPLADVLAGGTAIERALARVAGGVLPLVAGWLAGAFPDLFPSERTAKRLVADLKGPFGNKYSYCQMALYRIEGQKRPSRALVAASADDPRAALGRLLRAEIVEFRVEGEPDPPAPTSPPSSPAGAAAPEAADAAAPLCEGGYGDALVPALVYGPQREESPPAGLWTVRSVRHGEPVEIIDRPSARMPEHRFSRFIWIEPPSPEPRPPVPFVLLTEAEAWPGASAAGGI